METASFDTLYQKPPNTLFCWECVLWKQVPGLFGIGLCPKVTFPLSIRPSNFICDSGIESADRK